MAVDESYLKISYDKLLKKFEFWLDGFHSQVLNIGGKPFIEPEISPPGGSYQVTWGGAIIINGQKVNKKQSSPNH